MIISFIYGLAIGAALSYLISRKLLLPIGYVAVSREDVKDITERANKMGYAECQLDIVEDINKDQMALIDKLHAPNASASHSKYKREIMQEIRELDDHKLEILKSIYDSGVEVNLTIVDGFDGETKKIPLSEFIKENFPEYLPPDTEKEVVEKSESNKISDNVINLTDVRRGKSNGKPNPRNDQTD